MSTAQETQERYKVFLTEFARARTRLFRYIFSLLPNHADAEDVFQSCSLVLWEKFSAFDSSRPFLPWACGIAFNEVRYFLRSSHRKQLQFDSDLLQEISDSRLTELDNTVEILASLRDCLKLLSHRDRELVRVAYGRTSSLKEFAESINSAPQSLYNSLGRVRRQLQSCVRHKLAME